MLPTPIVVSGAENVTWTGETGCTPKKCKIIQPSYNGTLNCSCVVFDSCHGVKVSKLGFISSVTARYRRHCFIVKLASVEDAALHSVMLKEKDGLVVFNASGRYELVNSFIMRNAHWMELNFCPHYSKNCSLSLHLTNLTFINSKMLLLIGKYANIEYRSISVVVDNCSFTGQGLYQLAFYVTSYPSDSFTIIVRNSVFEDSTSTSLRLRMVLMVQNKSLVGVPQYRPLILLDGVSVSNSYYGVRIDLGYKFPNNNSCDVQHPEIIIANSSFSVSKKSRKYANVNAVCVILWPSNSAYYEWCNAQHSFPAFNSSTVFKLRGSKFHSNEFSAVVYLKGFSWHRAAFEGGNEISNNHGTGLELIDSQLEIHGYNVIQKNDGGGLYMTSDSLLLMANRSVLKVSNNSAEFGGGIHISYKGRSIASYEDFLHCYVYKTTCPGWCFFQFVDHNGHLLMQDNLNTYEANLNAENNHASKDGNEIFNGHLHNCSLMTKDRVLDASMDYLLKVLPSRVLQEDALDSLPHYICLCNTSNVQANSSWNCHQNLTLTINPGYETPLVVTVLKDFKRSSVQPVVVKDGDREIKVVTHSVCSEVYSVKPTELDEQRSLQLHNSAPDQHSHYLLSTFINFIQLGCPLGMDYFNRSCTCNSVLSQYGFECSVHGYKSAVHYNWIGIDKGNLIFSDRCILQLCNSSVLAKGLPSANITSLSQCSSEYGREGPVCSRCPENQQPEYLSFKCRDCPHEWIALLFILFIGGPLVVVILFLFNLTILQGTINGFILYCYMMIHTWSSSFFSLYAWKPLYIVFRLLSLGFGHGLCFFDEFSKALLHFAFPFYLLTLVATIIICAHKCNCRIFRVTFIARRAVPVLTTLMVMTFISLSDAVLLALQYNHIYDADTGDMKVVFLFDSSLLYFSGRHLAVGLIAIVCSAVYLLPLIFVTLLGDLVRRFTRSIWLSHFIDVFHGAYRYPFGFWSGVRLLARILFIVIALSVEKQFVNAISMFAIILCICLFQLYFKPFRTLEDHLATSQYSPSSCRLFSGHSRLEGILIKLQPSTLEFLYLLNAMITTAAITYDSIDYSVNVLVWKIVANASLIVALLQFLAILCYHTYRFLPLPKPVRMCLRNCSNFYSKGGRRKRRHTSVLCTITPTFDDTAAHAEPIMTIRLKPPQSGSHDNSYDSDESTSVISEDARDDRMANENSNAMTFLPPGPQLTEALLQK